MGLMRGKKNPDPGPWLAFLPLNHTPLMAAWARVGGDSKVALGACRHGARCGFRVRFMPWASPMPVGYAPAGHTAIINAHCLALQHSSHNTPRYMPKPGCGGAGVACACVVLLI